MSDDHSATSTQAFTKNAISAAIQIGLLFLLAAWCFTIIKPFVGLVAWAAIIAVALYPIQKKLAGALGGKDKLSVIIIIIIFLSILIVPAWSLTGSSIETAQNLAQSLEEGTLQVPPPNEQVAEWPIIGERVFGVWNEAASNLEATLHKYHDQVRDFSAWLLKKVAGTTMGLLGFMVSILISGALMLSANASHEATKRIGRRLAGDKGENFADLAVSTIRSVAKGVLGVAFIQTILATIGLVVMDVPGAGIWAMIILFLCIAQLPPTLILVPIALWVFSVADPVPATIFFVYSIIVGISDTFLKPLLLGRGVDVPMLVILLGAIGGMITSGIIGLFIGAVILALGYQLYIFWVTEGEGREVLVEGDQSPGAE
jgi:predicted PurR-regulated permease PerM